MQRISLHAHLHSVCASDAGLVCPDILQDVKLTWNNHGKAADSPGGNEAGGQFQAGLFMFLEFAGQGALAAITGQSHGSADCDAHYDQKDCGCYHGDLLAAEHAREAWGRAASLPSAAGGEFVPGRLAGR